MDLGDGLSKGIDIQVGNSSYRQEVDYQYPIQVCSYCHLYGHLRRTYPKNGLPKKEVITDKTRRKAIQNKKQAMDDKGKPIFEELAFIITEKL